MYGTAGWCTTCQVESADLPDLYAEYHPQGLEILAMVFEDSDASAADVNYAYGYQYHYSFPFPTVADSEKIVADYIDTSQAPMNVFVNLRTMEILHEDDREGYDAARLRSDIETYLASID
jgi:hypothetical protein